MSLTKRKEMEGRKSSEQHAEKLAPAAAQAQIKAAFGRKRFGSWPFLTTMVLIWLLAAAYYFLTPPQYKSKWTLILPASSSGSSVNLETIGQTSTVPGQPFGSVSLSPKVIYKEIASSEQVREAAARSLGIEPKKFGKARVKLIDETSLIIFQIAGHSPEHAQAKARALMTAFEGQLHVLRRDELEKRAAFVRENLTIDQANLDAVRKKIKEFQTSSGLLSIAQFTEASSSAELLRRSLAKQKAERERLATEQKILRSRLRLSPDEAAATLRLAADPSFSQLAQDYSKAVTMLEEHRLKYGRNHPRLRISEMKVRGILTEIETFSKGSNVAASKNLGRLVLTAHMSSQSILLKKMVANEAELAGRSDEVKALENALSQLEMTVRRMGRDAARLEALKKDHLVAEAVFTSAVARLNINRADQFSSYPMVQVLAQPSLPMDRSQPRLLYAVAAGFLGTFFVLLAWGALWIRKRFGRVR